MKQLAGLFALLVLLMLFVAWSSKQENLSRLFPQTNQANQAQEAVEKDIVQIEDHRFEVEIADTLEKREIGLTKYDSLEEGRGMLFKFEKENVRPGFWMKDMKFAIDIIWINDGKVAQVSANLPPVPEGTSERNIPIYLPNQPIDLVLEIKAGEAERLGIREGDTVEILKEAVVP